MGSVFIVMAMQGEYSERITWIAGVYTDRAEAQRIVTERNEDARVKRASYAEWERTRDRLKNMAIHVNKIPFDPASAGTAPELPEADDYWVVEAPVGQWGCYE